MAGGLFKVIANGKQIGQYTQRGKAVVKARLARRRGHRKVEIVPAIGSSVSARASTEAPDEAQQDGT